MPENKIVSVTLSSLADHAKVPIVMPSYNSLTQNLRYFLNTIRFFSKKIYLRNLYLWLIWFSSFKSWWQWSNFQATEFIIQDFLLPKKEFCKRWLRLLLPEEKCIKWKKIFNSKTVDVKKWPIIQKYSEHAQYFNWRHDLLLALRNAYRFFSSLFFNLLSSYFFSVGISVPCQGKKPPTSSSVKKKVEFF